MRSIYANPRFAGRVARNLRRIRERGIGKTAELSASRRSRHPRHGKAHSLPAALIVSLTSYPARFPTLHLTLGCLLDQSVKADRTILWIAHDDLGQLPPAVRRLEKYGLEIRACDDVRSYKKLVPTLEGFPEAYIATADDDIYFPRAWLERLVAVSEKGIISCHRAHRIRFLPDGKPRPYLEWEIDVQDSNAKSPSTDILPTSGAGALYPPNSLSPITTDRARFQKLCPDGDDLWFFWCAKLAGSRFRKAGRRFVLRSWPGSQRSSLWESNRNGGNDRMIKALLDEFGVESLG